MRKRILQALQQEPHLSGEELGQRLSISRTAVWKHINELRKQGYQIGSAPKRGYYFIKSTPLLLPEEIVNGLKTRTMGTNVIHYNEDVSTQDSAAELARNGAVEGTLVVAEMQTGGRGRKGRSWVSLPEGGVYLSLILKPDLNPSKVFQIPLVAGVAVVKAIRKVTPLEAKIKWPNDIIVGGRKAGGILTEMNAEIEKVNFVILGAGINVNIPAELLAKQTAGIATSLLAEYGQEVSRIKIIQSFLYEFETLYSEYLLSGFRPIREEWKKLNNTIGSQVKITDGSSDFEGTALDIDDEGFLLVKMNNGETRKVISGDVTVYNRSKL